MQHAGPIPWSAFPAAFLTLPGWRVSPLGLNPRLILLVALAVRKIGQHRGDAAAAGAPRRVEQEQQLHQVIVRIGVARLHHEDVAPAYVLLEVDFDGVIREGPQPRLARRLVQRAADSCDEARV